MENITYDIKIDRPLLTGIEKGAGVFDEWKMINSLDTFAISIFTMNTLHAKRSKL